MKQASFVAVVGAGFLVSSLISSQCLAMGKALPDELSLVCKPTDRSSILERYTITLENQHFFGIAKVHGHFETVDASEGEIPLSYHAKLKFTDSSLLLKQVDSLLPHIGQAMQLTRVKNSQGRRSTWMGKLTAGIENDWISVECELSESLQSK